MLRALHTSLKYWHLLSLDAPTVAALWCWAFGRAAHQHLPPWMPFALALGTWLFYVADRLLDARFSPDAALQERHRFHFRNRRRFLAIAAPVMVALCLAIARMPRSLLYAYCVLGALSLLYLGLVHLPARAHGTALHWFPKELAVALLFAAASALPAWDEARRLAAGMPRHHPLLLLCPLFAALCWLNCVAIEDWEQQRGSSRLRQLALLTIALCGFCFLALANHPARWLSAFAALSAALFLALDRSRLSTAQLDQRQVFRRFLALDRSRLSTADRRIAADLALLTPLFLMLVPWLPR